MTFCLGNFTKNSENQSNLDVINLLSYVWLDIFFSTYGFGQALSLCNDLTISRILVSFLDSNLRKNKVFNIIEILIETIGRYQIELHVVQLGCQFVARWKVGLTFENFEKHQEHSTCLNSITTTKKLTPWAWTRCPCTQLSKSIKK